MCLNNGHDKKVVLIGLDAAIPTLIQRYVEMDKLLNMKILAKEGTWAEGIPVFPTHTASNWTSISTGTWPTTHGVTDMAMHLAGTPLTEIKSGFYSDLCQADALLRSSFRSLGFGNYFQTILQIWLKVFTWIY